MIFCVEDDEAIRGLMLYALHAAGFAAKGFPDGEGLFHALGTEPPRLILLDNMLPVGLLPILLSAVLAGWMARRIVRPLNSLDLEHPLENDAYGELTPLPRRIHQQRQQISAQLWDLQRKTDELEQITGHMREGPVLLDSAGKILSINPPAHPMPRRWRGRSSTLSSPPPRVSPSWSGSWTACGD